MNPAQLLTHFDRLSDAPDVIPRLRRFILDLAVRGKLVEQDPRDEPASELLKRIDTEKALLVKQGKIRKQELVEDADESDTPFELPAGWLWSRLGNIGDWGSGSTPPRGNSEYYGGETTWLKSGELGDCLALKGSEERVTAVALRKCSFRLNQPGDVLIAMYGATIGKLAILAEPAVTNQAVCGCTPFAGILNRYLFTYLLSRRAEFHAQSEGGAQPNISKVKILQSPFPLPPFAEQHRIVAKVDELMVLCDGLEAAQVERESRRDRLVASSLNRLNNGADPDAFRNHARFYFNRLPRLTTGHEHVKKLRGTILNLAFRGWLTSPWREAAEFVGTAQEFRLSVENARKKAWDNKQVAGSSRKYPSPIEFDRENLPTIPDSWVWASADAVCSQITDGEHIQPRYQPEGLPMLTAKHVRDGFVTFEDSELISETDFKKCVARCKPEEGDILVVSVGATTGRAAIVSQSRPFALVRSVLLLKPLISPAYFLRWLQSPWCFVWMRQASEASAQPHLYIGDTRRMPVPLPPLAEQERIVAKVDELMALCEKLEVQLTTTQTESRRLLEAVLHEALEEEPLGV